MIYLDSNATTFPDVGLFSFLEDLFAKGHLGNPSSVHAYGRNTKQFIRDTSHLIQTFLSFSGQVIYTSGATEGLNLIISSLPKSSHVITSSMEHSALLEPLKRAALNVSYLDPDPHYGVVTVEQIYSAITPQTTAILLGWVNSEIGTKINLQAIAELASSKQLQLIVDATAIIGREKVNIPTGVTSVVFSGHKFHALSGIGCLLHSSKMKITPQIFGGGQQYGIRSGTENICGIASLQYVFHKLQKEQDEIAKKILQLRDFFEDRIEDMFPEAIIHYRNQPRVNNVSAIAFPPLEGEVLQIALDMQEVACSFGSACSSGATTAFRSLSSLGLNPELTASTLRFSFSHLLTLQDVKVALDKLDFVVKHLKEQLY